MFLRNVQSTILEIKTKDDRIQSQQQEQQKQITGRYRNSFHLYYSVDRELSTGEQSKTILWYKLFHTFLNNKLHSLNNLLKIR
ncbi:MAG: hypothetical protein H0X03_02125 [Nitrosopumilus sp.]|nr:hypothetical protein [Nitrosopumilus sp.]